MDFVFKVFFLQFLIFGLLVPNVRLQSGGTDCRGKDYLCLDDVRFQLCVDYGDGRPTTVNEEVQQCPQGTFCSNAGQYECDSFVPPSTTAEPHVNVDDSATAQPVQDESAPAEPTETVVVVEEATLPPVVEESPETPADVPTTGEPVDQVEVESTPAAETPAAEVDHSTDGAVTEAQTNEETPEAETAAPSEVPELPEQSEQTESEPVVSEVVPEQPTEESAPVTTSVAPEETHTDASVDEVTSQSSNPESEPEVEATNAPVEEESSPSADEPTEDAQESVPEESEPVSTPAQEPTVEESSQSSDPEAEPEEQVEETTAPAGAQEDVQEDAPQGPTEGAESVVTEGNSHVTDGEESVQESSSPAVETVQPEEEPTPEDGDVENEVPSETSSTVVASPEPETEAPEGGASETTSQPESQPESEASKSTPEPAEDSEPEPVSTSAPAPAEPNASESGSDEGSASSQDSTERPSGESGAESNEATPTPPQAPGSGSFLCPAAGRYAHPTDCHRYYVCFWLPFGLFSLEQNCLAGYAYNPTLERCTADQSVCFPGEFTCMGPGRFPDPADPTQYFWCVWNMFGGYLEYKMQCPAGQVFNPYRGRCAFVTVGRSALPFDDDQDEQDVEESTQTELESVQTTEPALPVEETPKPKVKFQCLEEGTFADPNNCGRYFVCTLKKLDKFKKSKFKCVTGERFDPLMAMCVPDVEALCE
ncbi:retinitis pigmentosa 1-like 1 protein [Anopheles nili]|uniref:retinitis pigmentosa 1-like 1 protein n=1 Tax=Anopheles nili TaxID=185578 RepID=UPI00237B207B|nr:retinitis pigmentosa 1-like 1 protein [Anopheles nili]